MSNIQNLIKSRKIDGLLIINPEITEEDWDYIKESGIPFVVMHFQQKYARTEEMDFVYTDHKKGGYLATTHLINIGRRKIICLSEDNSSDFQFEKRTEGYLAALQDNGLPVDRSLIFSRDYSFSFGYELIKEKSELIHKIDAIFAEADLVALGCIEALKELGVGVPGDISVVGCDDIELGKYFKPRLTTVHQPREEHAIYACNRLNELIEGGSRKPPMQKIVPPRLVVRESCGAFEKEPENIPLE